MKLVEYDKVIGAYKTYISDLVYLWPQARSISGSSHYKSMGQKMNSLFYALSRAYMDGIASYMVDASRYIFRRWPSKGHLRSLVVTNSYFFANNLRSK